MSGWYQEGKGIFERFGRMATFSLSSLCVASLANADDHSVSSIWASYYEIDLSTFDLDADADGDGLTGLDEAVFGTDPLNGDSVVRPTVRYAGIKFFLEWNTIPGALYQIEVGTDLVEWDAFESPNPGTGARQSVAIEAQGPKRFFRVRGVTPPDGDSDGLNSLEENFLGTDPDDPDSDGDSFNDGEEAAAGANPGDPTETPAGDIPPEPANVAPPTDPSAATNAFLASKFLYTGDNPIQTGVAENAIDGKRAAIMRGKVTDYNGTPLPGVKITILDGPEFGQTLSRSDGMFDLVVNGGGTITVRFERNGFLPVQRSLPTGWLGFSHVPDVALIRLDTAVTQIDLTTAVMQVARGNPVSDDDGVRQATLLFPSGTTAELVLPDGSTQAAPLLSIRATEYSVGANGLNAMRAVLPPTSGYTYCVELTTDEGLNAGASAIRLSQPVPFYVENFLDLPVGGKVPSGYYDPDRGVWVPVDDGRIVAVVAEAGGRATLDVDGDGVADEGAALAALGITDDELGRLAQLYAPGQSLWRVPLPHFSCWDHNWPIGPPSDATAPNRPHPTQRYAPSGGVCQSGGTILSCPDKVVGARVDVTGTSFSMHYRSNRARGFRAATALDISLTGASFPASLKRIDLEVFVAGRHFTESFTPRPIGVHSFIWDRKDAYGRSLQGLHKVETRLGYTYKGQVQKPAVYARSFALFGALPITGSLARQEITIWQPFYNALGSLDALGVGLGGWTIDIHHFYDPLGRTLYRGDGSVRSEARFTGQSALVIETVAGTGAAGFGGDGGDATAASLDGPGDVATGADGVLYIADTENNRIRMVGLDGAITTFAGTGAADFSGDGGPAVGAELYAPIGIAVGPDGSIYFSELSNHRVRRVDRDGVIDTVAGSGPAGSPWVGGFSGDDGPATQARLDKPQGIAVDSAGCIYIADSGNARIRRVGTDGTITTVAGGGSEYSSDIPATQKKLLGSNDVALAENGTLYVADILYKRIFSVRSDGVIRVVAGNGKSGFAGDEGPALDASFDVPTAITVGPDGTLYIADLFNERVRMVTPDGVINTLAGDGDYDYLGDGGPAGEAALRHPGGLAVGKDGGLYFADKDNHCVRKLDTSLPGFSGSDVLVTSADGNLIYHFNSVGRHLSTSSVASGKVIHRFNYDANGLLVGIANGSGVALGTVERDAFGLPTALVGVTGMRLDLETDANGYLSRVTKPGSKSANFAYTSDGLLVEVIDFDGALSTFTYDDLGYVAD